MKQVLLTTIPEVGTERQRGVETEGVLYICSKTILIVVSLAEDTAVKLAVEK